MSDTSNPDLEPSPANGLERAARPLGWGVAALAILYAWAVATAPIDSVQGEIQKILYVHPPLAYGAYLGFVVTAIGGLVYLWKDREDFDRLAIAGAEVGLLFCTLMMITGPIWARGTWGPGRISDQFFRGPRGDPGGLGTQKN